MERLKKNLILGLIIIAASVTGYFLREREMQGYVVETETEADVIRTEALSSGESGEENPPGEKININTAGADALERLDGIGEAKAKRIVSYREKHGNFEVIEDIMKVDGIGRKTFELFKDDIIVE